MIKIRNNFFPPKFKNLKLSTETAMVKSIVIDDHANKLLENLLDKKVSFANTGLIIGTVSNT